MERPSVLLSTTYAVLAAYCLAVAGDLGLLEREEEPGSVYLEWVSEPDPHCGRHLCKWFCLTGSAADSARF